MSEKITCKACGAEYELAVGQEVVKCNCAISLIIPYELIVKPVKTEPIECYLCRDTGLVVYWEQCGGLYEMVARCVCKKGQRRRETGIPDVLHVEHLPDLTAIARKNGGEWSGESLFEQ